MNKRKNKRFYMQKKELTKEEWKNQKKKHRKRKSAGNFFKLPAIYNRGVRFWNLNINQSC